MRAMGRSPYLKTNQFSQYARPPHTPPQIPELGSNQALVPNSRGSSSHSWSGSLNPFPGGNMPPDNQTRNHNSLPPDLRQPHLQQSGPMQHSEPVQQMNLQSAQAQPASTITEQNYHVSTSFPMQSSQTINPAPFQKNLSNDIDKDNQDGDDNDDDNDDDEIDESDETTSDTSDDDDEDDDELSSDDQMNLGIRKVRAEGNKNHLYYCMKHRLFV